MRSATALCTSSKPSFGSIVAQPHAIDEETKATAHNRLRISRSTGDSLRRDHELLPSPPAAEATAGARSRTRLIRERRRWPRAQSRRLRRARYAGAAGSGADQRGASSVRASEARSADV